MTLFVLVFLLELWPMVTFIRWRIHLRRGAEVDTHNAQRFAVINTVQAVLVVAIAVTATAMAWGIGY